MEIEKIFRIIKTKIIFIISITLVIGTLTGIYSYYVVVPIYETNTKIFIGMNNEGDKSYNANDFKAFKEVISTYVEIIKTSNLVENAIDGSVDRSSRKILDNLSASAVDDTQIIEIKYKDSDRYIAKTVIDNISKQFINESEKLIPGSKAEIIEKSEVPEAPAYPNKLANVICSLILGFVFSCLMVLGVENYAKSLTSIKEIEEITEFKTIGIIPKYNIRKGAF